VGKKSDAYPDPRLSLGVVQTSVSIVLERDYIIRVYTTITDKLKIQLLQSFIFLRYFHTAVTKM